MVDVHEMLHPAVVRGELLPACLDEAFVHFITPCCLRLKERVVALRNMEAQKVV